MPASAADLKKAIKKGDLARVRQLLEMGLPMDAELPGKVTALEFSLAQEKRDIVWELLRRGARPRLQKKNNLLLDVPKFRDLELLRRLIDLGADIHAPDRNGSTPLLIAVAAGFYDAVRLLLDLGADPRVRDADDRSVFQLAEQTRRFCTDLLPGSEPELAEQFRSQLEDLDRIEAHLQTVLTPEQVQSLRGDSPQKAEPSTFWDLNDLVELRLEIAPFPFAASTASRLTCRLGREGKQWVGHFTTEGRLLFRVTGNGAEGDWRPLSFEGLESSSKSGKDRPTWLLFTAEVYLPSGQAAIELRIESDREMFQAKLEPWKIEVSAR